MIRIIMLAIVSKIAITALQAQTAIHQTPDIDAYRDKVRGMDKLIHDRDWTAAIKQWRGIISLNPTDGEIWYQYGESLYFNSEYGDAIEAFKRALQIGALDISPADCCYYIARCYAKQKQEAKSMDWLQESFDLGFRVLWAPVSDSAFFDYRNSDRFRDIVGIPPHELKNREEGWRFDLHLLAREIKRRRVDPFKNISRAALDSAIRALEQDIPKLSDMQIIIGFMKIMCLVHDGHSMIYAFYERPELLKNLPLDMFFFREGLFITAADNRYKDLLGCEILGFDGKTVPEIMAGLDPIINRDNEIGPKVMGIFRMRTLPLLYGLGLIKSPEQVSITVKDPEGRIRNVTVVADCPIPSRKLWDKLPDSWSDYYQAKGRQPPEYLKNPFQPYWFEPIENKQAVYFQYNRVSSESIPFEHFCDSLFDFIHNTITVDKLVIDLRLNNGGNTQLLPYLLAEIIGSKKINRTGHLFVITGRRTFSAAQNFCGWLERFTRAVFIGEPTGSSPNFTGEEMPFELPYSKLLANISDRFWQSSWPSDTRAWTTPFFYIEPSFLDFAQGRDPDLKAVLESTAP